MFFYSLLILFMITTVLVVAIYLVASIFKQKHLPNVVKRDYSYQPTISVLLSCFNEGSAVYKTIKSLATCNYPSEKLQIIAFDDCSKDDSFEWMQKAAVDFPNVTIHQNPHNQGKALTFIDMAKVSKNEILIGVDSDCTFHPDYARELVACFADPTVGGVGGVICISNVNDTLLTQMQTMIYSTSFYLFKSAETLIKRVQCLGGPLVAFKRETYFKILPRIESRNFLGVKITNGEDRAITQYILALNLKTVITYKAKCWTSTPTSWIGYLKQQLRWRRSAIGQWLDCLFDLIPRIHAAGPVYVFGSLVPMLAMIFWNLYALYLMLNGTLYTFLIVLCIMHAAISPIIGGVFNHYIGRVEPTQKIANPFIAPMLFAIWFPINIFVITIMALFTLDDGGWVTRQRT